MSASAIFTMGFAIGGGLLLAAAVVAWMIAFGPRGRAGR